MDRIFLALLVCSLIGASHATACGKERWPVKTGMDVDAKLVDLAQIRATTIQELTAWPAPATKPQAARAKPHELEAVKLDAVLTLVRSEKDEDVHLVLSDEAGRTMVAEIPEPDCVGAGSPFASGISAARAKLRERFPAHSRVNVVHMPVRITGVAFFDIKHGQTGLAPNGIELHPILDLQFLDASAQGVPKAPPAKFTAAQLNADEDEDDGED